VELPAVGLDGVEDVEGLGAVPGRLHADPLALQPDRQRLDEAVLVLDEQDRRLRGHGRRASWGVRAAGAGPAGSRSVKVEPAPSRDRTRTSPRWLDATWRTMARPRPVPPVSRLRARSTR